MKILYATCHGPLHFAESTILRSLGHEVQVAHSNLTPCDTAHSRTTGDAPNDHFDTAEADALIVMHNPEVIENNWAAWEGKPVYWRTIGQSNPHIEHRMAPYRAKGLRVIRYSPKEKHLDGYIGSDGLIRFGLDPAVYSSYTGETSQIMMLVSRAKKRSLHCSLSLLDTITRDFPRVMYGAANEDIEFNGGYLPFDELRQEFRRSRVFVSAGTYPASYTMGFIEAFMTGSPVVAADFPSRPLYEVGDFIEHGVNGFCSDDVEELRRCCQLLLDNHELAKEIGARGRETAIELFGTDRVREDWKQLLAAA